MGRVTAFLHKIDSPSSSMIHACSNLASSSFGVGIGSLRRSPDRFNGSSRPLRSPSRRSARLNLKSVVAEGKTFQDDWLKAEVPVHLLTLFGWTVPSAVAVPAYGDQSLFFAFCQSISQELSHFPTGPAIDDKFWLYLITWHIGLFSTMLLGQIGWQGRKQGYFK